MLYIKPSWRKNLIAIFLIVGGLGWLNLRIVGELIGPYPYLRGILGIVLVILGLYEFKGGVR